MRTGIALATLLVALAAMPAAAQNPSEICPEADQMILRISRITPSGSVDGFLEAVSMHSAWYRSRGFSDNAQVVGRVLERDSETGAWSLSDSEIVTIHRRPPDPTAVTPDAEWNAFIERYRQNSVVEVERLVCISDR